MQWQAVGWAACTLAHPGVLASRGYSGDGQRRSTSTHPPLLPFAQCQDHPDTTSLPTSPRSAPRVHLDTWPCSWLRSRPYSRPHPTLQHPRLCVRFDPWFDSKLRPTLNSPSLPDPTIDLALRRSTSSSDCASPTFGSVLASPCLPTQPRSPLSSLPTAIPQPWVGIPDPTLWSGMVCSPFIF